MSKKKRIKQDWTPRRKMEWDGKQAPPGQIYLIIKVRKRYEAAKLIISGQGAVAELEIQKRLREVMREQYKI